jgi:hypothetical protein
MFLNFPLPTVLRCFLGFNFSKLCERFEDSRRAIFSFGPIWKSKLGTLVKMLDGVETQPVHGCAFLLLG